MNPTLRQRYGINNDRPIVALAPMAGVTDLPFRTLCEAMGADFSVTEMAATAPRLLASQKNQKRLHFTPHARVNIVQIIGNQATEMAQAARQYADLGADIIDINLGCPAKKVNKKGAGSALLADLKRVEEILTAVTHASPVPITVKTRLGTDHDTDTVFEIARLAVELEIELLTIHGRTRACRFSGTAQFEQIAAVKYHFPQLAIIANGDIDSLERCKTVLTQTRCDGVMIGRGAIGQPWLLSDIRRHFDDHFIAPHLDKPALILRHIAEIHNFYGPTRGVRFARKHIRRYLEQLQFGSAFSRLAAVDCPKEQLNILADILMALSENTASSSHHHKPVA
ncbi:MAG: tRNA dihydrouridine synthase DusB [Gammaproteobacteria bacterium]|nr:MAG: tRNA dihydrouridine synthase DusB [Gammaproteobacteria bacterium]